MSVDGGGGGGDPNDIGPHGKKDPFRGRRNFLESGSIGVAKRGATFCLIGVLRERGKTSSARC